MNGTNRIDTIEGSQAMQMVLPTWGEWAGSGIRMLRGELVNVMGRVRTWMDRSYQRRMLASMEAHRLEDIGVSRAEAERESTKAFWQS